MADKKTENYLMAEIENIFDEPEICENSMHQNVGYTCTEGAYYVTKNCPNCDDNRCKLLCAPCTGDLMSTFEDVSTCGCLYSDRAGNFFSVTHRTRREGN